MVFAYSSRYQVALLDVAEGFRIVYWSPSTTYWSVGAGAPTDTGC
ncbi:hypothetical protein ABH915_002005 [Arthrobacter sp. MW3 TE3886]